MPLKIMPHGRLQEWVADEKGYFTAEGLESPSSTARTTACTRGSVTTPGKSRPVRSPT